jgi:DNA replicative helicase MCM subunit Mcm2 (Cdc46/Mcm family)
MITKKEEKEIVEETENNLQETQKKEGLMDKIVNSSASTSCK